LKIVQEVKRGAYSTTITSMSIAPDENYPGQYYLAVATLKSTVHVYGVYIGNG
jgi:hypothetical protein